MTAMTIANDMRARRDAVRLPSRQAVGGIASLPEIIATYGIYLFFGAVALAGAIYIINQINESAVVDEARAVVKAVSEMYQHSRGANKVGLTRATVANSGRLPREMTERPGEVWIGNGDYPVHFASGVGMPAAMGWPAPTAPVTAGGPGDVQRRFAVIQFGDTTAGIPNDLCSEIALGDYPNLVGIAIIARAAGGTAAAAMIGTPAANSVTTGASEHWSISASRTTANVYDLDELGSGLVDRACSANNGNQHVALILR